ncbi:isoleucine--tRNA ligase [Candidatus Micrarchaeota archaeon]|nr:MAG: isoleucine--tRNA ligase [Candidatus Micrarchaeota archaeon]
MQIEMPKSFDHEKLEKELNEYWKGIKLVERIKQKNRGKQKFYYLDGPPYANAPPHIGHALTRTLREVFLKYKQMNGFDVWAQPGFDTHGLPVEVIVQQKLGLKSNEDIERYGIDKFNKACREHALSSFEDWKSFYEAFGSMATWSLDNPYLTYKNEYISSSWLFFKHAKEKNMIYKGKKSVPWCPKCGTSLSAHEASQEYREVEDTSIYLKFKKADEENTFFLVWTTTPWTLPGNVAITVHPKFNYSWVELKWQGKEETWIIAEPLVDKLMAKFHIDDYLVTKVLSGKEMEGMKYIHIMEKSCPYHKGKLYPIVLDDYITTEEGTGLVHTAPGHGPEDYETGLKYGLEILCPVDEEGIFTEEAGKYKGLYVFDANEIIIEDLKKEGSLIHTEKVVHRYPHCWRCKSKLIFRASPQWFIRIAPIKEKMLKENEKVRWVPDWAGHKRFKEWLENARDWCISHQKYWGIPLPIWECECGHFEVISSIEELKEKADGYEEGMDLHRPYIDRITMKCPKCGKTMHRVKDVTDVWFDSGAATWASFGYPENKEFERWFPIDFITEAVDQTRGWFYTLMVESVTVFERTPYLNVLVNGLILDPKGEKMSKSKGNVIHPMDVIKQFGADVFRWYLLWSTNPWEDTRFDPEALKTTKAALNTLWNSYSYAMRFSLVNGYTGEKARKLYSEDKWIISKLENMKKKISQAYENLDVNEPARLLRDFIVNDLSRNYIKFIRDRIRNKDNDTAVFNTLFYVLSEISKLMAPICPFVSEEIYLHVDGSKKSVHLENWPIADEKKIDNEIEESMQKALNIIEAGLSARNLAGINLRQALREAIVVMKEEPSVFSDLIAKQLNVLSLSFVDSPPLGDNYIRVESNDFSLYLNVEIDEELRKMGINRELLRRIQQLRKEAGLIEKDEIITFIDCSEDFKKVLDIEQIKRVSNSKEIRFEKNKGKKWQIGGEEISIEIEKIQNQ